MIRSLDFWALITINKYPCSEAKTPLTSYKRDIE